MAHKHRHITPPEAYRRYLDGLMSARERHEFEKTMLNDDFESEALEGLADLNKSRFKKDLSALQSELRTKTSTDTVWKYWRLAAVFLLLAAFSFSVYYLIDSGAPTEISQSKKHQRTIRLKIRTNKQPRATAPQRAMAKNSPCNSSLLPMNVSRLKKQNQICQPWHLPRLLPSSAKPWMKKYSLTKT